MSSIVRNAAGSGILCAADSPGCELYARTRSGENSVIVTGSLLQMRFRSRLCSQSTPKRARCALRCQVIESVRWNRRPRLSIAVEFPISRPACGMLIDGAPSPRHRAQSCSPAAPMLDLMTKEENRRSLTSVGRRTLVSANQTLIGPGHDAVPVRRIRVRRSTADRRCGSKGPAAIVRVADEDGVRAGDFRVEPHAEQITRQRARGDPAQVSEVRRQQSRGGNRPLIVSLPVPEVENAVAADGTAEREAELLPLEERIRIALDRA